MSRLEFFLFFFLFSFLFFLFCCRNFELKVAEWNRDRFISAAGAFRVHFAAAVKRLHFSLRVSQHHIACIPKYSY